MRTCTAASSLAVLLALPTTLAGLFDAPQPLLAFSHPKSFVGGLEGEFSQRSDNVLFLPGFHPCGTLTVIALDGDSNGALRFDDFGLFPRSNGSSTDDGAEPRKTLMDYYNEAKDPVLEERGLEGTVLSWAKGWRSTCGKGAINRQVRVVKVSSADLLGKPGVAREAYLDQLDARIAAHLANLEPAPHNNLVVVTPISPSTRRLLFDVATPSIPHSPNKDTSGSPSSPPDWKIEIPSRRPKREHSWIEKIFSRMIDFAILSALTVGLIKLGTWGWKIYQDNYKGRIRLPFTREEANEPVLDLDAE